MNYPEYKNKRILVTGGAGAIGSNLTRSLLAQDAEVIVLDNLSSGQSWKSYYICSIRFVSLISCIKRLYMFTFWISSWWMSVGITQVPPVGDEGPVIKYS